MKEQAARFVQDCLSDPLEARGARIPVKLVGNTYWIG